MNKTKRIVSTLVLLTLLCALFAVLPAVATETDGNLLTNGILADADGDGKPDGWFFRNAPSLMTPTSVGYEPPTGWTENYVDVNCVTNTGIQQVVKKVEPGQLYRVSALYQTIVPEGTNPTSYPGIWEFIPYYFENAESSGKAYADNYVPVALAANNSVANPLSFTNSFTSGSDPRRCEYIFRMPALAESVTLPDGASIGLLVRIRTSNNSFQVKIADLRLEKTDNWVVNGSFENGEYGWTQNTNCYPKTWNNDDSPAKIESTGVKVGSKALKLIKTAKRSASADNTATTDNHVLQKVYVDAGKTYRIRFWFNSTVNETQPRVGVLKGGASNYYAHYANGNNVSENNTKTQNAWRQYTYYFTADNVTTYVEIRLSLWNVAIGTEAWFDGVELTEVEKEGDIGLYSAIDGAVLAGLPKAGQEVQVRAIRKTGEETEDVTMITCLYKMVNGDRVLDSMLISVVSDIARSKQHSGDYLTTAGFVDAKATFEMPDSLEVGALYEIKSFIWDSAAGIKPMADVFGLQ
ncbi:MAG: hypothetical protein E7390_05970 [Ruminococcaceae bacterium]|nr:hypothetical protein [Oscillospiraceae bacterium]